MRVRYLILAVFASVALLAGGAAADTGFVFNLSAAQEVPVNASPATGMGFAILNAAGTTLTYSVTYSGLTSPRTASHFHAQACPGFNSGVQLGIAGAGPVADNIAGAGPVNATLLAALLASCPGGSVPVYCNIHSQQFPGGEIRGQLFPDVTPNRTTTWGKIKTIYR